jgi:ATP-dependent protease Clp ATPase subunit
VMYELPSRKDVSKCMITRETVLSKVQPALVLRADEETPPAKVRRERSA